MANEVRLIDANKLYEKSYMTNPTTVDNPYGGDSVVLLKDIEDAPTIDPESLRPKGQWVLDEECAKWGYPFICTAEGCGKAHNYKEKYCPNCGAKMEV